jgi:hypothetical protein
MNALKQTDFLPTVGSNPLRPAASVRGAEASPACNPIPSGIFSPVGGAPSRACCARFLWNDLVARTAAVRCGPANRDTEGRRARDLGKISAARAFPSAPVTFSPLPQILSSPICWPLRSQTSLPPGHGQQRRRPPPPAAPPARCPYHRRRLPSHQHPPSATGPVTLVTPQVLRITKTWACHHHAC